MSRTSLNTESGPARPVGSTAYQLPLCTELVEHGFSLPLQKLFHLIGPSRRHLSDLPENKAGQFLRQCFSCPGRGRRAVIPHGSPAEMGLSGDVLQPLEFPFDGVPVEGLATAVGQHWASSGWDPSHTHTHRRDSVEKGGLERMKRTCLNLPEWTAWCW